MQGLDTGRGDACRAFRARSQGFLEAVHMYTGLIVTIPLFIQNLPTYKAQGFVGISYLEGIDLFGQDGGMNLIILL